MTELERLILKTEHDQEQEWTEGRTWYTESDGHDVCVFAQMLIDEDVSAMTDNEIAVMCRLALLALMEIANRKLKDDLEAKKQG